MENQYKCLFCKKTFYYKSMLLLHQEDCKNKCDCYFCEDLQQKQELEMDLAETKMKNTDKDTIIVVEKDTPEKEKKSFCAIL